MPEIPIREAVFDAIRLALVAADMTIAGRPVIVERNRDGDI